MQKIIQGTIVASVVEPIGNTDMKEGFITIRTTDDDYVKLDVGSYTSFETLDEGAVVCIEADVLGTTDILYAERVTLVEEPT
ncbi:MAG: hypothetical protein ACFFER_01440 [Candidatus Thorarchaeota archaeon]